MAAIQRLFTGFQIQLVLNALGGQRRAAARADEVVRVVRAPLVLHARRDTLVLDHPLRAHA